jgi:uncharacterized protein YggL (DUF469 family)
MPKIKIAVETDTDYLASIIEKRLSLDELKEFIFKIDSIVAEFEFTEDVVNHLIGELRSDEPDWEPYTR